MRGFTDRALLLLSSREEYEAGTDLYKTSYRTAVKNILTYLKDNGMELHCLITDELACTMPLGHPVWLATSVPEDLFFMHTFCGVPTYDAVPLPEETENRIRKKYPVKRGLKPRERFDIVSKRVKQVEKELIVSYQFVIVFGKEFNPRPAANDGRAILHVNEKKFNTSMELSGSPVPICDFMQIPYASLCLSEWGKYHA